MDYKAVIIILFNSIIFIIYTVVFLGFLIYYCNKCDSVESVQYNIARKNLFIGLITIGVLVIGNVLLV